MLPLLPEAYGDQCERCGATLSPEELINPYNAETGNPLVRRATKHWYLPLDRDQEWLTRWIVEGGTTKRGGAPHGEPPPKR